MRPWHGSSTPGITSSDKDHLGKHSSTIEIVRFMHLHFSEMVKWKAKSQAPLTKFKYIGANQPYRKSGHLQSKRNEHLCCKHINMLQIRFREAHMLGSNIFVFSNRRFKAFQSMIHLTKLQDLYIGYLLICSCRLCIQLMGAHRIRGRIIKFIPHIVQQVKAEEEVRLHFFDSLCLRLS